jgi:ADP-ribosylglycohydrolase
MNTQSQPLPNNQDRHTRAKGAVIGALIGDAAGGVLEFIGRAPTQIEVAHALNMPGGGVLNLAPGQITDDGEMILALMQALAAENGEYKPNTVAQAYSNWERSKPFDIGIATLSALKLCGDAPQPSLLRCNGSLCTGHTTLNTNTRRQRRCNQHRNRVFKYRSCGS